MGERSIRRRVISKCKGDKESYLSDRISLLPDEILISILSLLPLEEAARTCILSRRWKSLGVSYHRNLVLYGTWSKGRRRDRDRKMARRVTQVLQQHQGSTIDKFNLRFNFKKRFQNDLNEWVKLLSTKLYGIKSLELDFSSIECFNQPVDKNMSLPNLPLTPFSSLTCLSLKSLNVSEEYVQGILNNCLLLEYLCLSKSDGAVNLKVPSSLLWLKYLEIVQWDSLKKVEVYAPNLSKFKYYGDRIELFFDKVPQLTNVSIGSRGDPLHFAVDPLSSCFAHLKTLYLQPEFLDRGLLSAPPPPFPAMPTLSHLELYLTAVKDVDILGWASFIVRLPALQTLTMSFILFWSNNIFHRAIQRPPSHYCPLKTLKIRGFRGDGVDIDFIEYVVENAVELEKLIFIKPESGTRAMSLKKSLREGAIFELI